MHHFQDVLHLCCIFHDFHFELKNLSTASKMTNLSHLHIKITWKSTVTVNIRLKRTRDTFINSKWTFHPLTTTAKSLQEHLAESMPILWAPWQLTSHVSRVSGEFFTLRILLDVSFSLPDSMPEKSNLSTGISSRYFSSLKHFSCKYWHTWWCFICLSLVWHSIP